MNQSSQWRTGHFNQLAIHRCCGLQALAQQRAETLRLGPSTGLGRQLTPQEVKLSLPRFGMFRGTAAL